MGLAGMGAGAGREPVKAWLCLCVCVCALISIHHIRKVLELSGAGMGGGAW